MKKFLATFLVSTFVLFLNVGFCGPISNGPIGYGGVDTSAPGTISEFQLDHNVELLNADRTVLITDKPIQWYDPNGSDRNVTLSTEVSSTDLVFTFYNDSDGAGEDLVIRDDTPTTLITIGPGQGARVSCDGTSWKVWNDKGIYYDGVGDYFYIRFANNTYFFADKYSFGGWGSNKPLLLFENVSATNPTIAPRSADTDTGIGAAAADQLSLIAGGVEGIRVTSANVTAKKVIITEIDPTSGSHVGNRDYNDDRYAGALSYGIMWNENQDTYIRIGDPYLFIHDDMKRCILSDAGVVQYYLEEDTSYNRDGVAPSVTGTCDANATKKITDTGVFTGAAADYVGRYVHDTTDDVYAMITAKDDNDTLSLQTNIFVIGDTFEICTAVLNGDDGQVMVEILAFYHKYWYDNGWHGHSISYDQLSGYTLHHAFQKNGANVTARYMGAYEGVLYDTSETKYVNGLYLPSDASYKMSFADNGVADDTITSDTLTHPFTNLEAGVDKIVVSGSVANDGTYDIKSVTDTVITLETGSLAGTTANDECVIQVQRDWTADVLASVSGKAPMNQGTRAQFRAAADRRGTGWRQQSFDLVSAVQLLYLIEYGSWYSQSEIGNGLTDWSGANWVAWNNYNPIEKTGLSNILGNATGNVSNGSNTKGSYMSYRGIENFYGHLWKWVDGINVNNNVPYVCNVDTNFAGDTATNYTALGVTLANASGYQVTLEQIARGFLPLLTVGGSSSTYITDYYYQGADWRVARRGGGAHDGAGAGAAYWGLHGSSADAGRNVAGRVCW